MILESKLTKNTNILIGGKTLHLFANDILDTIFNFGHLKIVTDNKVIYDSPLCFDIFEKKINDLYAEMIIKRAANVHLLGHPLLDAPWSTRMLPCSNPYNNDERTVWEKYLDSGNYVYAYYYYCRL